MKRTYSKLVLLFLAAIPALAQLHDTYQGHDVAANQVIVKINSNSPAVLAQLSQLTNADDVRPLNPALQLHLLHARNGNITALLAILRAQPSVVYAEPDYFVKASGTPNDPSFSQQWALRNTSFPGADIGATSAWDISTGSTANVIGVVDTGIDYTHPDLAANVWSAPTAFTVTLRGISVTCPAGSHGYNAIIRACDPRDDNDHGTHVSGSIGAVSNNGLGVSGVNWTTRIMGLKFLDSSGNGTTSDAIDCIEFSIQAKAAFGAAANVRVLSNSWGGGGFSQSLLAEINRANSSDMLFVVAAGNSAKNTETTPEYPGAFIAANLISVAATNTDDSLASFSNYGKTTVSLGAPGVNILSTLPGSSYGYLSGTSMAAPHVSGAAMLVLSKCALNTADLKSTLLSQVDPDAALSGITVTGGRLNVNKALRSCAAVVQPPTGSAAFLKTDATTSGNWKGVYGAEGNVVIGDSSSLPSYATLNPSGNSNFVWAGSTGEVRAPQKASSAGDRIAACWYKETSFSMDLNFTDGASHQVAVYFLDWDQYLGGRTEQVDVLDGGTGATLDSRSVSAFSNGQYLVWNLGGHVVIRVTNTNPNFGANAVVNAIFFGGAGAAAAGGSATFLSADTTTGGTWQPVYGSDGASIFGDSARYPAYANVTPSGALPYTWAGSTSDPRAMQKLASPNDRIAACLYTNGVMSLDVNLTDGNSHQVAIYLLDWDSYNGRAQRVEVLDGNTGATLDTRVASGFVNGQYLVWSLRGHVILRITNINPSSNAVIGGLLFGGGSGNSGNSASFVRLDTTTQGTWKGTYGGDGAQIFAESGAYPAYAALAPSGNLSYIWAGSTVETRAVQKFASATDRIASCWYSATAFSLDLRSSDSARHQVALYFLDWDYNGRNQQVEVLDGDTNAVLDTRSVSSFTGGQYLVWNLGGHVVFRITNLNPGTNAVVSGIFFK